MTREQHGSRIAALCLIAGSMCVLVFRVFFHGDLPTDTGEEALSFVAARPLYPLVHFADWLGVLVWTGGLVAFSASLTDRTAWMLGRLGAASALVGAAVHITEFSVDGYALPTLANAWVGAAAADRASLEFAARLALVVIGGPSVSSLLILWGTTLTLFGLAANKDGYATSIGWIGVVVGAVIVVLAAIQYLKPNVVFPGIVLYGFGTVASQLWTIALGFAAWRRARDAEAPSERRAQPVA
jgi:hypothetical protein